MIKRINLFPASLFFVILILASCDVNPYDPAQEPHVTVKQNAADSSVIIEWQPAGSGSVQVYRNIDKRTMWEVHSDRQNSIASPVTYGMGPIGGTVSWPMTALEPGTIYTAEVIRDDTKGSGDGFSNTHNKYIGRATFTFGSSLTDSH